MPLHHYSFYFFYTYNLLQLLQLVSGACSNTELVDRFALKPACKNQEIVETGLVEPFPNFSTLTSLETMHVHVLQF